MKQVVEWREVKRDRRRADEDWMFGHDWRLRRVRCDLCGNEWWEVVQPRAYADDEKECACGEGGGEGGPVQAGEPEAVG